MHALGQRATEIIHNGQAVLFYGGSVEYLRDMVFNYPRASDLTSPEVQQYSDREIFWIVKNGIRLSGMPAFGKIESDEHIWNLVHYVRTLPGSAQSEIGGTTN